MTTTSAPTTPPITTVMSGRVGMSSWRGVWSEIFPGIPEVGGKLLKIAQIAVALNFCITFFLLHDQYFFEKKKLGV